MLKSCTEALLVHNGKVETIAAALVSTTRTMYFSRCVSFFCFFVSVSFAANTESASVSLQRADHYADLYNWADSRPFYLAAERELRRGTPDQIHAHVGYLRATMEERSLPELSNYLAAVLKTSTVDSDPRLRLWCLGIKGDVDGEMDSASARADWEEANRVARQLGDEKWSSRSAAEAGFEAYLQGDIATGRSSVAAALLTAHKTGDAGAEIRYLSAIGTGIEWNGAYKEAVVYFEKASALAQQHPDSGYPFLTVAGEVETLIKEREFDSAERLIKQASAIAIEHKKLIKLTQLMLFDADIAIAQQQLDKAVDILQKTIPIAEHNHTNLVADAQIKLAKI
jgi:tetratricopeptide (TPR) repeat protein